jgi:hypothetical protein
MKSKANAIPIRKVITFRSNVPVPEAKITEKDTDYRGFDLFFRSSRGSDSFSGIRPRKTLRH